MPLIETLVDDFDTGVVNTGLWTSNYGTYSQTGGRARVACTTAYNGFESAAAYTLAGSSTLIRVFPPAAGGAATEAYASVMVLSPVDGTEAGFLINTATGKIRCAANTDYWDSAAVELTYDPVAHAYVRLSEADGSLVWATSPDGTAWTTRRTLATPTWVTSGTTLALGLQAHRDSGVADFAEFDDCNTLPTPGPDPSAARKAAFLAFF